MTTLRTDLIPNLFPNRIVTVSKASTAVVSVPVVARVASTTGTIGTIKSALNSGVTTFATVAGTATTAAATYVTRPQASTSRTGAGATFTIVKAGSGTAYSGAITVTVVNQGAGYESGDTITISGFDLGGASPTNDLTLTLNSGSLSSTGPWSAVVGNMTTTENLVSGQIITATAGTGTFAAGGQSSIARLNGSKSIILRKVGGTIPTAGTVTNITLPAVSTLPPFLVNGDPIAFTNPGNELTFTTSTGTFVTGETISQPVSGATGVVTDVFPTYITYTVTGVPAFNTSNIVTGDTSGATTTPTGVTGMHQLLTAGANNTNVFYVNILTPTTFELYRDAALTTSVISTNFTTYTTNAGQYTTTDTVVITEA
jgi:hypothetical protein